MSKPDFQAIGAAFKAYRADPTPETKAALRALVAPHAKARRVKISRAATAALMAIDNPRISVAALHWALVQSASMADFDVGTLAGGQTPED